MSPAAVHSAVDGTPTGTVHSASAGARPSKVKAEETTLTRAENPFADAVPWSLTGRCSKENRSSGDLGVERRADHDGETARERISDSPDQLWKHHTQGLLDAVELALPVPEDATVATRLVAADLALLLGLRLAVGDLRPVPYAIRWRAGVLGLSHTTVRRALSALVEAGALAVGSSSLVSLGQTLEGRLAAE